MTLKYLPLLLLLSCAGPQAVRGPVPTVPTVPIVEAPKTGPPRTVFLPFRYPAVNLTNYWWYLQASTDLVHWETIKSLTTTNEPTVTNTGGRMFFRVKGMQ